MPTYHCKIKGSKETRVIRADTAAQARNHLVTADPLTADALSDLLEGGAKVEKATAPVATEPEPKDPPATEPKDPPADGSDGTADKS